ncbi:MAG: hypothetical protein VKK04_15710 [Synechococcales bacterium]|nr:hypothetical protein [Synechococcales bacterium]
MASPGIDKVDALDDSLTPTFAFESQSELAFQNFVDEIDEIDGLQNDTSPDYQSGSFPPGISAVSSTSVTDSSSIRVRGEPMQPEESQHLIKPELLSSNQNGMPSLGEKAEPSSTDVMVPGSNTKEQVSSSVAIQVGDICRYIGSGLRQLKGLNRLLVEATTGDKATIRAKGWVITHEVPLTDLVKRGHQGDGSLFQRLLGGMGNEQGLGETHSRKPAQAVASGGFDDSSCTTGCCPTEAFKSAGMV